MECTPAVAGETLHGVQAHQISRNLLRGGQYEPAPSTATWSPLTSCGLRRRIAALEHLLFHLECGLERCHDLGN